MHWLLGYYRVALGGYLSGENSGLESVWRVYSFSLLVKDAVRDGLGVVAQLHRLERPLRRAVGAGVLSAEPPHFTAQQDHCGCVHFCVGCRTMR